MTDEIMNQLVKYFYVALPKDPLFSSYERKKKTSNFKGGYVTVEYMYKKTISRPYKYMRNRLMTQIE